MDTATLPMTTHARTGSTLGVITLYASALAQGLAVVSFPASGNVLRGDYGITDEGYGAIFLPQMALTILGSLGGAALSRRISLRMLLLAASALAAASQLALASVPQVGSELRLALLLLGTGLMGAGFGLSAAPLNALPALLFPARAESALVALHTSMGLGFALGPLVVSWLSASGVWTAFPLSLLALSLVLSALAALSSLPSPARASGVEGARASNDLRALAPFFAIAALYAFAEGTFSNWASIFLVDDRHLEPERAALALSAFWAALAVGRLLISALLARVPARIVWPALMVLMAVAFLVVPLAQGPVSGVLVFALAGLGCSAVFPLTVGLATLRAPDPAGASSLLVASLMVGVGTASFALGALRSSLPLETIYRLSAGYPLFALVLALVILRRAGPRNGATS